MATAPARRLFLRKLALYRASATTCYGRTQPYSSGSAWLASADPSRFVTGVTEKDLEDPNIAAFFAANFSDRTKADLGLSSKGSSAPKEGGDAAGGVVAEEAVAVEETDPLAALNIRPLSCHVRNMKFEDGTRACVAMRNRGLIPGILYGSDPTKGILSVDHSSKLCVKTPWNQIQRELDRYHHSFEHRVYNLTVYESKDDDVGKTQLVVPKNMQRHPVQHKIFCVNYLRYHPGRPVPIPIRYINEEESPALKRGGFIAPISRTIDCIIEEGAPIPESIGLECTGLQLKQVLRTERLIFPDGVKPSWKVVPEKFLVGTVFGKSGPDEEEEGEAAGGEEGKEAKAAE